MEPGVSKSPVQWALCFSSKLTVLIYFLFLMLISNGGLGATTQNKVK